MKTFKLQTTRSLIAILFAMPMWVSAVTAGAQSRAQGGQPTLKQRVVLPKPLRTAIDPAHAAVDVVVLKFREGTHVRERAGFFDADLRNISDAEERLLRRANLPRQHLFQDLARINSAVGPDKKRFVRRLFSRSEAELDAERSAGEANIREELADLNLYHMILIADAKVDETERLIDELNALDSVEIAYAQPVSKETQVDMAPTTPDLTGNQGYLNSEKPPLDNGIDVIYARSFPGTRGNDVQIIDVEKGWNLQHEDMPPVFFQSGSISDDAKARQHGTEVLGVLAAAENGYGMTGIVPQSRVGIAGELTKICGPFNCWWVSSFEDAVNKATAALRSGDILVIELQTRGPKTGGTAANCFKDDFEYIPMEFIDANFDAIKNATSKGIIVVEGAGNGQMDLDAPIYKGKFDRSVRDSGAIMVAAGGSGLANSSRAPLCFTNFGSRLDLQGWGENVATLGKPDIKINSNDENQFYSTNFSGTSAATPIVAGAAAALQGYRKAHGLTPFNSIAMRDFLRKTGTAQSASPRQIGPLPNLRAAIDAHRLRTLKVTFLSVKVVDNYFPGPHPLTFNFRVNDQNAQFTGSFPQATLVNLPTGFSLTGQELLDGGLTVQVTTNLQPVIVFDFSSQSNWVMSRPVQVFHSFPTGTDFYASQIYAGGLKIFTDRSTDAAGYFEVTYKVEVMSSILQNPK